MQQCPTVPTWHDAYKQASIQDIWHSLSPSGRSVLAAFILVALGMPISIAVRKTGTDMGTMAANPDLRDEAHKIVHSDLDDPYTRQVVEHAMAMQPVIPPEHISPQFSPSAQHGPSPKYAAIADDHSYLIGRIGQQEYDIISKVADQYGLRGVARKLLFCIRIIENGRNGLEMGVGDGIPNHPARRYADDFEKSLALQAQWAAGTVSKRFTGDIDAFAQHYCQTNWKNWARMAREFLLSSSGSRGET